MSRPAFSETALQLAAVRGGDRAALNDLLARYLPWVRQTAALRLGRALRKCQEIDDIVQQSLLDAFRSIESFEQTSEGGFRNWLARVVVNNVLDLARWHERRPHPSEPVDRDFGATSRSGPTLPAKDASPSQFAQAHELEERIEHAMLALTATHREILVLRERCGMDYAEIAKQLDFKNADTARALHHRALTRLQQELDAGA